MLKSNIKTYILIIEKEIRGTFLKELNEA